MTTDFATAIRRALAITRAGNPQEATALIKNALVRRLDKYSAGRSETGDDEIGTRDFLVATRKSRQTIVPEGATYLTRHLQGPHGARDCKVFVPSARAGGPTGLVVMLHGCTQNANDFACGTGMNKVAESLGFVVLYPEQTHAHNIQSCWNWYRPEDQGRAGEPAMIADLALQIAEEHEVPAGRIFVAGLSAGGAMAAILASTHREIFAAAGIHSGLPAGCAKDVPSAFAAMRGTGARSKPCHNVPLIVFHGTADTTVASINAEWLVPDDGFETSHSGNGRSWTRLTTATGSELWLVRGGGHAWFGGDPSGSYTDPSGPDASREMLRFFNEIGGVRS
jgi:poly(hydroxyalkanoate) depolymerase family esterase